MPRRDGRHGLRLLQRAVADSEAAHAEESGDDPLHAEESGQRVRQVFVARILLDDVAQVDDERQAVTARDTSGGIQGELAIGAAQHDVARPLRQFSLRRTLQPSRLTAEEDVGQAGQTRRRDIGHVYPFAQEVERVARHLLGHHDRRPSLTREVLAEVAHAWPEGGGEKVAKDKYATTFA